VHITLVTGDNPGPYTGAGNNTYLIAGETPTLIDAATGNVSHLDALASALDAASLAQVLVTHAHPDHADGCDPIAARWPAAAFCKMPWPERDSRQSVDFRSIADGDLIPAGSGVLRAVHTPGHAPDHLCFFDETDGTLFSADLVILGSSVVIPSSRGGSLALYLDSLRRIRDLRPARMLPAHGPVIDDPGQVIDGYIAHRQRREGQVVDAMRAGARLPDAIVERLYQGLKPELLELARESVLAHLIKLRDEGRVRENKDEDEWTLM
jgi:glyoxylase-like metal-dependent hydrolase (beta-lactamase superfamily II)